MRPPLTIAACLALIATPGLAQAQRVVYLVRHAEKTDDATDPSLTDDGVKRAKTLARMLGHALTRFTSAAPAAPSRPPSRWRPPWESPRS